MDQNNHGSADMTRMTSLRKNPEDQASLQYGRFRNMGACVASEYYQHCPFFFTREGAEVNLTGMYKGRSAFLLASGPSFKNIRSKTLRRPGAWVMTLNNAVASFRGNAAIIVDDPSRFTYSMWLDPKITKFVPVSHWDKPLWDNRLLTKPDGTKVQMWQPAPLRVGDCPSVLGYRRNEKFVAARYLYEDTINWGCHKDFGGSRSVMLAALRILFLMGFRTVYLLGVDFEMSDEKKYHFDEERTPSAIKGNMSTYEKLMQWFAELQPYFLAENFHVFNCNPQSRLKAFPFMEYGEALRAVDSEVGDVSAERTMGLYSKYEEKLDAFNRAKAQGGDPSQIIMPPE